MTTTISVPGTTTSLQPYILNYIAYEYPTVNALIAPTLVSNLADQFVDSITYLPTTLSRFNTTNIEDTNNVRYAYNTSYDTVSWYIFDYTDILNKKSIVTHALSFNNSNGNTILFRVGYTLKITVISSGFSTLVTVTTATMSGITFTTDLELPLQPLEYGLKITSVTTELYPKSYVFTENIANGIKPTNGLLARANLFAVEQWPNLTGVRMPVEVISSPSVISGLSSLDTHPGVTGDVVLPLTSQSAYTYTSNASTVNWYIYDYSILTYSTDTRSTKFVYFATQLIVPFPTGSSVRITNTVINYSKIFNVIIGTNSSILINSTETFDQNNTYIDSISNTVYYQSQYQTITIVTPRDRFFYFNVAPGIFSAAATFQFSNFVAPSLGSLAKPILSLNDTTVKLPTGKLAKPILSLKDTTVKLPIENITKYRTDSADIKITSTTGNLAKPILSFTATTVKLPTEIIDKYFISASTNNLVINDTGNLAKPILSLTDTTVKLPSEIIAKFLTNATDINIRPVAGTLSRQLMVVNSVTPTISSSYLEKRLMPVKGDGLNVLKASTLTKQVQFIKADESTSYLTKVLATSNITNTQDFSFTLNPLGISKFNKGYYPFGELLNLMSGEVPVVNYNSLNVFQNVPEGVVAYATGQQWSSAQQLTYNTINWLIYEQPFLLNAAPTSGLTQTIGYVNLSLLPLFYKDNYVRLDHTEFGFTASVQIVSASVTSITFASVNNLPTVLAGMIITSISSPLYSQSFVYSSLVLQGIRFNNTTPRENFFSLELKPMVRGEYIFRTTNFSEAGTNNILTNALSLFDTTKSSIPSDVKLQITNQSSVATTSSTNTVSWYVNEDSILKFTNTVNVVKTVWFNQQLTAPFNVGSTIKLAFFNDSFYATVISCTNVSVRFLYPTDKTYNYNITLYPAYIESTTASVFPQRYINIEVPRGTPRHNFYMMYLKPSTLSSGNVSTTSPLEVVASVKSTTVINEPLVKLSISSLANAATKLSGESTKLTVSNLFQLPKLNGDNTRLTVSNLFQLPKLAGDSVSLRTPLRLESFDNIGVTGDIFTVTQSVENLITIVGTQNYYTSNVPKWYAYDQDILKLTQTTLAQTLTLFFAPTTYVFGQTIALVSPLFCRVCTVVSSSATSVTIINPSELIDKTNLSIYTSTTISFNSYATPYIKTGYVKLTNTNINETITCQVLSTSLSSVTIVKPFDRATYIIAPAQYTYTIENQNPSVYPALAASIYGSSANNRYARYSMLSYSNIMRTFAADTVSISNIGRIEKPQDNLRDVSSKPAVAYSVASTLPIISWSPFALPVIGRSGYSVTPSIATWYAYDADILSSKFTVSSTVTLYVQPTLYHNTACSYIKVVNTVTGYIREFPVLSFTSTSFTIATPDDLQLLPDNLTIYTGLVQSIETIAHTNVSDTLAFDKFTINGSQLFNLNTSVNKINKFFVDSIVDINSKLIIDSDGTVLKFSVEDFTVVDKKPSISNLKAVNKIAGDTVILTTDALKSVVSTLVTTYIDKSGKIEKFVSKVADITSLQTVTSKIPIQFWN